MCIRDSLYTDEEFRQMLEEVRFARECGADCVVAGLLTPDGRVDEERTARLVAEAGGMEVTFHRAFDMTRDCTEALEALVRTGCRRVLTSGGRNTVSYTHLPVTGGRADSVRSEPFLEGQPLAAGITDRAAETEALLLQQTQHAEVVEIGVHTESAHPAPPRQFAHTPQKRRRQPPALHPAGHRQTVQHLSLIHIYYTTRHQGATGIIVRTIFQQ